MEFAKIHEYDIGPELESKILRLLTESFPGEYPTQRIYYKQIPHLRYVAFDKDMLVAQVGLDYRVMNLNGQMIKVLGIIDLCVSTEYRDKGIGSQLLKIIEGFSKEHEMDFLLLFADKIEVYRKNGYIRVKNTCVWTKIDEGHTLGVGEKEIRELMIKRVGTKDWNDGTLDMLGYLY